MNISYNWLREHAPVKETPEALAEVLTMGGLEVEGIESIGSPLDGVVVGRVERVRPHPNAQNLRLCYVCLDDDVVVQIVCGAPNVAAGQHVPVATVGTTLLLPNRKDPSQRTPVTIKAVRLRGEVSSGMICAEDELGLSGNHDGIMVLEGGVQIGRPFVEWLRETGVEPTDTVFDVAITPNRPDAASHLGVARDAAALTGTSFHPPDIREPEEGLDAAEQVSVDIQAPQACPRYVAMLVRDVTVRESPAWLRTKLTAIGLRPRNHVVDVTNYVLHDLGQPLHAFDLNRIEGNRIRVRLTDEETPFTTLDDKQRTLPPGTLMIADGTRDVAIAGVMGGKNSEVSEATTHVLIESAFFDPSCIRETAKALGLQTDASYRFERGVDREGQARAAARAAALIAELGGGTVVPGMVDAHPGQCPRGVIEVRPSRVDRLLGIHVTPETTTNLLMSIGFEVETRGKAHAPVLRCVVPSFRPDIEREIDVIEEIVRLYGYDRVPMPRRPMAPSGPPHERPEDRCRRRARTWLKGTGYREIYTNSMLPLETAERFNRSVLTGHANAGEVVETRNPISRGMAALRPSLLPGALRTIAFNRNHGQRTSRFFEFGHVFHRSDRKDLIVPGYREHESLLLVSSGVATTAGWDTTERVIDLFDLKGRVEALLDELHVPKVRMQPVHEHTDPLAGHLEIHSKDVRIGIVAELADGVMKAPDQADPIHIAELDWTAVVARAAPHLVSRYRAIHRYPPGGSRPCPPRRSCGRRGPDDAHDPPDGRTTPEARMPLRPVRGGAGRHGGEERGLFPALQCRPYLDRRRSGRTGRSDRASAPQGTRRGASRVRGENPGTMAKRPKNPNPGSKAPESLNLEPVRSERPETGPEASEANQGPGGIPLEMGPETKTSSKLERLRACVEAAVSEIERLHETNAALLERIEELEQRPTIDMKHALFPLIHDPEHLKERLNAYIVAIDHYLNKEEEQA